MTYNPPSVSSDTTVVVSVTVTARGTGTVATDGTIDTDSDTEAFTVNDVTTTPPGNLDPDADAGSNQNVDTGASVNLDGTGSTDDDGTIVSYSWARASFPGRTYR